MVISGYVIVDFLSKPVPIIRNVDEDSDCSPGPGQIGKEEDGDFLEDFLESEKTFLEDS